MTGKKVISAWENGLVTGQKAVKITQCFIVCLVGFSLGLIIAAVGLALKWDADYERMRELIIAVCVTGATALALYEFRAYYSLSSCADWLIENNANLSDCIKEISGWAGASKLTKQRRDYKIISSAAYLAASPDDRNDLFGKLMFCGLTAVIMVVCAGICATQNADEWIRYKVYGENFNFNYGAFIPTLTFTAVYVALSAVCNKMFLKSKSAWLNSLIY